MVSSSNNLFIYLFIYLLFKGNLTVIIFYVTAISLFFHFLPLIGKKKKKKNQRRRGKVEEEREADKLSL